jgi:hypothetical protein
LSFIENNERFIVDRRGEPVVVIMSVQDFIRTAAPPPDWLQKAWSGAKRRGLDTLARAISTPKLSRIGARRTPSAPAGRSDPGDDRNQCAASVGRKSAAPSAANCRLRIGLCPNNDGLK